MKPPRGTCKAARAQSDPRSSVDENAQAGFGAYGEKLYGKGHSFMTKYFPGKGTMYPYLNVTRKYVLSKLSLLLCPFLTKGDWRRVAKSVRRCQAIATVRKSVT